jgi:predicted  nucleic acid-binding Zn-ribbon protein
LVNLFNKKRPLIYKIEEGKYIIDLASTLKQNIKDIKEIRDPNIE